jgi:hypothetical protein
MSNNRSGVSQIYDSEHSFILSKKLRPANTAYFKRDNVTTAFICFKATSIVGAILGIFFFNLILDAVLNSATFKAFSQCLSKQS